MSGVRTIYLGTSDFAATVLRRLAESPHRPNLVLTPPDRKQGRGRKLSPPPVAIEAADLGIDLLQIASVNRPEAIERIRSASPEIGCVCAFGQLIKEPLLDDPPMYNIHPSLLPRWRGAAPIERAMIAGDAKTGVSVMRLTAGLDSGPVAIQSEVGIDPGENFGSLAGRLATIGGDLLVEALDAHAAGTISFTDQTEDGLTYAEKIEADDRRLDPALAAAELADRVAGLTPHIGAFFELEGGDRLGITDARVGADDPEHPLDTEPGSVSASDGGLQVRCGGGSILEVARLKPPGKREMDASDYLRGHTPTPAVSGTT